MHLQPGSIIDFDDLFFHKAVLFDLDGDGIDDVIATGEGYFTPFGGHDEAWLYYWLGVGNGQFDTKRHLLSEGFGSLLQLVDVDQDGDEDIVSGEYFHPDAKSAVWLEQTGTSSTVTDNWVKHTIDDTSGPSIQFEVVTEGEQMYGLVSNHTNTEKSNPDTIPSGLYRLEPTDNPTDPWVKETIFDDFRSDSSSNQAAPGVFSVGDIDGDQDMDILISGDGDPRVFLFIQDASGYKSHVLFEDMPQAAVHMVDTNNDGQIEMLVGSYDRNVVMYLQREAP